MTTTSSVLMQRVELWTCKWIPGLVIFFESEQVRMEITRLENTGPHLQDVPRDGTADLHTDEKPLLRKGSLRNAKHVS
jgi:hypothetical protein